MMDRDTLTETMNAAAAALSRAAEIARRAPEAEHVDRLIGAVSSTCRAMSEVLVNYQRGWGENAGSSVAVLEICVGSLQVASDRVEAGLRKAGVSQRPE